MLRVLRCCLLITPPPLPPPPPSAEFTPPPPLFEWKGGFFRRRFALLGLYWRGLECPGLESLRARLALTG